MFVREQTSNRHRRLFAEQLEPRRLLAGDVQNPILPEDTNNDGVVSPIDAFHIISALNNGAAGEPGSNSLALDVNGDGERSPMDALHVINNINRGRQESGVPVESRIRNLRAAIETGRLPGHITAERAQEILDTLESGGRPELGDRYRDGQLVRHNAEAPATEDFAAETGQVDNSAPLDGELRTALTERLRSLLDSGVLPEQLIGRAGDLLEYLESDTAASIGELLRPEGTAEQIPELLEELRDRATNRLQDAIDNDRLPDFLSVDRARELLATLNNGDATADEVLADLREAFRDPDGSLRDQVREIVDQLDLDELLEEVRVDVGTLIEAGVGVLGDSDRDAVFAGFVGGSVFGLF